MVIISGKIIVEHKKGGNNPPKSNKKNNFRMEYYLKVTGTSDSTTLTNIHLSIRFVTLFFTSLG